MINIILFSVILLLSTLQKVAFASEKASRTTDAQTQTEPMTGLPQVMLDDLLKNAVSRGQAADYVEDLLQKKADPNCKRHEPRAFSLLHEARRRNNKTVADLLVKHGACLQETVDAELVHAVYNNTGNVKSLLDEKADLSNTNYFSQLLAIAAGRGHYSTAQLLIEHGPKDQKHAQTSHYSAALAAAGIQLVQHVFDCQTHPGRSEESNDVRIKKIECLLEVLRTFKKAGANMRATYKTSDDEQDTLVYYARDGRRPMKVPSVSFAQLASLHEKLYIATYGGLPRWYDFSGYEKGKKYLENFQKELLGAEDQKSQR